MEDPLTDDLPDGHVAAGGELAQRARDAVGRALQPLALGILAELLQERADEALEPVGLGPR